MEAGLIRDHDMERMRRRAIPFPLTIEDNSDIAPRIEQVAKVWGDLDQTDFSHLDQR
jgi:hypothetical protein